ncbi:hypothetical protein [Methanoregula sp.]|jgi:hypothetical protein|uniref:hypothetical protein n=1 Tax=Methanoregula sp. TaxID=2052170 RepID=UPI003C1DA21A
MHLGILGSSSMEKYTGPGDLSGLVVYEVLSSTIFIFEVDEPGDRLAVTIPSGTGTTVPKIQEIHPR